MGLQLRRRRRVPEPPQLREQGPQAPQSVQVGSEGTFPVPIGSPPQSPGWGWHCEVTPGSQPRHRVAPGGFAQLLLSWGLRWGFRSLPLSPTGDTAWPPHGHLQRLPRVPSPGAQVCDTAGFRVPVPPRVPSPGPRCVGVRTWAGPGAAAPALGGLAPAAPLLGRAPGAAAAAGAALGAAGAAGAAGARAPG